MDIEQLIKERSGIRLDIGCGNNKQPGFVGLDIQPLPGVDIVWDINRHPWPIPDECVATAICSHLIEHIPPVAIRADGSTWFPFLEFMNEVWRVTKVGGQFAISCPHATSPGYYQDPTHCNQVSEDTFCYFTPEYENGRLWLFYKPLPWHIDNLFWNPAGNIEAVLRKMARVDL